MNYIAQKIREYRADILLLIPVLLAFGFLCSVFFAHQPNPVTDVGIEGYMPLQMLKGQVLYKDILLLTPLAYQINAFLFSIFGASINTLYFAGIANSLIILFTVYFIARNLTTPGISTAITYMVISFAFFTFHMSNYLFPYTYSVVYAVSAFLLSVLFLVRYFKTSDPRFVVISSFFISLSILSKYEFIPYLALLVFTSVFYKPMPRKYILYCIIAGLTAPILSFSSIFLQGAKIEDVLNVFAFAKIFGATNEYSYFLSHHVGFYCSKRFLLLNLSSFMITVLSFAGALLLIYGLISFLSRIPSRNILFITGKCLLVVVFYLLFPRILFLNIFKESAFCWLPLFTLAVFAISVGIYLKNKTKANELFCLVVLVALVGSCKSFFLMNIRGYGTFLLPLLLLVNIIFFIEYFPGFFKFINKKTWKISFLIIITSLSFLYSLKQVSAITNSLTASIKSERGTIYTFAYFAEPINKTIEYINKNIPEDKTFLVVPGSLGLNFYTGRDSNNKYYDLNPPSISAFGEQNVIDDLKKNPPDYIFMNNNNLDVFGKAYFCRDYGLKLCNFIRQDYEYQTDFGRQFQIVILKKK